MSWIEQAHEEVLLLEPQLLAHHGEVVRVEDLRDVLGEVLVLDRREVVAGVEVGEVELLRGARAPEAQRVHRVVAEARRSARRRACRGRGARRPSAPGAARARRRRARSGRRTPPGRRTPGAGSPRRSRSGATPPAARPGSRCGSPGRRSRTRSGCRSRRPGTASVASESRKQAASRPRPPLPSPASGSCSRRSARSRPRSFSAARIGSYSPRFSRLFSSARPMRNSSER